MPQGAILLDGLAAEDREWLFATARERILEPGAPLIKEGESLDWIHFVLRGFLEVSVSNLGRIAALGEGEIVGEMSFVERRPAVATVAAPEGATVLSLSFAEVDRRLDDMPGFSGRWFQGIARLISRRHRLSLGKAEPDRADAAGADLDRSLEIPAWWAPVVEAAADLKRLAERHVAAESPLATEEVEELTRSLGRLESALGATRAGEGGEKGLARDELSRRLREDLAPLLKRSDLLKRILDRPRGVAGDYLTLQSILEKTTSGRRGLGPALDRAFLELAVSEAFRARAKMMEERILEATKNRKEPLAVTCLAAGPADELFEIYRRLKKPESLKTTLIDIDSQAVLYMSGKRDNRFLERQMEIVNENVLYLATGRTRLALPPQDMVYSLNLLSAHEDGPATGIVNFMHGILKPGGLAVLGAFLPENPSRAILDHLFEWRILHRGVDDLNRLYAASAFGRPSSRIRFDDRKTIALAECVKPAVER